MIEELPQQTLFKTSDGRIFQKGEQLRKRFKCVELKTKKLYLFSPVYEVETVEISSFKFAVDSWVCHHLWMLIEITS
jgi:hypothetical protein